MATVVHPGSGKVTASYAAVAKHHGVQMKPCPPRRGNREGVVEKANHSAAQRWRRTLPDDITVAAAQAGLDDFCATVGDTRDRVDADGNRCTVADLAARERLAPLRVAAFPAEVSVPRVVSVQGLVSFRGNRYSVPPELAGGPITVTHRLGSPVLTFGNPTPPERSASTEIFTSDQTSLRRHTAKNAKQCGRKTPTTVEDNNPGGRRGAGRRDGQMRRQSG